MIFGFLGLYFSRNHTQYLQISGPFAQTELEIFLAFKPCICSNAFSQSKAKGCDDSYLNFVDFFSASVDLVYKSIYNTVREQYLKILSTKVGTNTDNL